MTILRQAARALSKTPALSLTSIALLAAGIGGGTLLFGAFESVWLRPLPVRHPQGLVRFVQKTPQLGTRSNFDSEYYRALKDHSTSFESVFGFAEWLVAMNEPAPTEQVRVHTVTPQYFAALGVDALYGRVLGPDDDIDHAVLSYPFWQRRFHGARSAVGQSLVLHGHRFTIVGVLPREFNGITVDTSPDIRIPLRAVSLVTVTGRSPERTSLDLSARLRPGVTRERAQAESIAIWRSALEKQSAADKEFGPQDLQRELERGMQLDPLERGVSVLRDKFGSALELLTITAGLLLLMVCANVAGLMLAGAAARRAEIAVRLALGATRAHLVRQMLAESSLLVLAGGFAGWWLAWLAAPLLTRALPPLRDPSTARLPLTLHLAPDARVILASLAAAAAIVAVVAVVPAIAASRTNLDGVLRGIRATHAWGGRKALVIFQVALCTLLLGFAGLLMRTFETLKALDTGFDRQHVITFTVDAGLAGYTNEQSKPFWQTLTARVRDLPGVASVAAADRPLMRGSGMKSTVAPAGEIASRADFLNASFNTVSPEYFDTMGIRIVEGRGFTTADIGRPKPVPAIVNEAFVRRFFPDGHALGRQFGNGIGVPTIGNFEIVGIARDAKYRSLREPMTPTFYTTRDFEFTVLCVRTRHQPEAVIQPVRRVLASLDAALPFTEIHTLSEEVDASAASERLTASLASVFAGFAALLAAAGIYGLLAFTVEQRRREIGIRMALGARPRDIGVMLGGEAATLVLAGLAAGLAAAVLFGRWGRMLLYGVTPSDPLSLGFAALSVLLVACAATAVPAGRAARVSPASSLRG